MKIESTDLHHDHIDTFGLCNAHDSYSLVVQWKMDEMRTETVWRNGKQAVKNLTRRPTTFIASNVYLVVFHDGTLPHAPIFLLRHFNQIVALLRQDVAMPGNDQRKKVT